MFQFWGFLLSQFTLFHFEELKISVSDLFKVSKVRQIINLQLQKCSLIAFTHFWDTSHNLSHVKNDFSDWMKKHLDLFIQHKQAWWKAKKAVDQ